MKKHFKTVAVMATLLIAAAGAITFEACNKKNEVVGNVPQMSQDQGIVYQKNVPDREAYIVGFEKKLKSAGRSTEFLTVENANAFLFDMLNYDFGDIQEDKDDMLYETATYTVNVTNGVINLSDFAGLYRQISLHAYDYYHSLDVANPHYYYIYPRIEEFDANATTATVTVESAITTGYAGRAIMYDSSLCDYFIYAQYAWDDAADTLRKYFDLQYPNVSNLAPGRYYFSNPNPISFTHDNYNEIYYCGNCSFYVTFDNDMMCDLLNAYMDIADEYGVEHGGLYVMSCIITPQRGNDQGDGNNRDKEAVPIQHILTVNYSTIGTTPTGPNL